MSPTSPITIGFSRHTIVGAPYWTIVEHGARERAQELGIKLIVHHNWNGAEQVATMRTLLQQQVQAMVIAPFFPADPTFMNTVIDQASQANIPLIAIDSKPTYPVASVVRSNDYHGMIRASEFFTERLGGRGKVVHLQGQMLVPSAQQRSAAVHTVLDRFPEIEIVAETDRGDWQHQPARDIVRKVLRLHPDIAGVIAANDAMALGAISALAEIGRQALVIGVDGDADALRAIEQGALAATVRRSPYQIGRVAVDTALAALQGQAVPAEILLDDMTLITKANATPVAFEMLGLMSGVVRALMESSAALGSERTMLRTIIDTLPDAIYVKDRESRFEVANQAIAQLMGVPSPEALLGKTDFEFYPHELAAQYRADELAIIESGVPLLNKDEQVVDPSGAPRWVVTTKVPLYNNQGQVIRVVGRGQDITERRRIEQERRMLEHKLLETQKLESLGVLAGGIAHDFNNLLVAILGSASLALLDLPLESPARESVEQIEIAAQRAADLTRQMLAYAGKGRFVIQRINANIVIEEMTHLLHASIPKNVVLRYHLAETLPAIEADATQLRQIIMNLVVNAADAIGTEQGIISITTSAQWADEEYLSEVYFAPDLPAGHYIWIEVADTGCGMDAATRAKIFDPFFTTKFTGRGLGLAAVQGIVRGHKGALNVYSEPGKGSTFKILLPSSSSPSEQGPANARQTASWQGSGTVLVIDDEPEVRTMTSRMLQRCGFNVLTAADGASGIALFEAQADTIVCVLLDMTMPQLDGQETFRLIRRIRPNARVVLMSGYNEQEAISRFAGKGITAFLPKPFTLSDLRERLEC